MKHLGSWVRIISGFGIGHTLASIGYRIYTWQFWFITLCVITAFLTLAYDIGDKYENKNRI